MLTDSDGLTFRRFLTVPVVTLVSTAGKVVVGFSVGGGGPPGLPGERVEWLADSLAR
ncbi:hypothetical protein B0G69_2281 [Paraburkholderia sp. RAU2J]|nr:hypothetical protein B0G69_2281 [Paraburkholderia sp. RAU2J]